MEILKVRAVQLILKKNFRDAEYIYTQILGSNLDQPMLWEGWEEEEAEIVPDLVLLCAKMGNFSAAEAAQENLLRWMMEYGTVKDDVTPVVEKLHRLYAAFYDRIRDIITQHGDNLRVSTGFGRMAVFCRTAALDIEPLNRVIAASDLIGVPELALLIAARAGATSLTAVLIEEKLCNIDATSEHGFTALHLAVVNDQREIAQQLLEAGANVNTSDRVGQAPLSTASRYGSAEMVQLLTANNADVGSRDSSGRTALHWAVDRQPAGLRKEVISNLIEAQIDIETKDHDGRSALGLALGCSTLAVARQLLGHGADLEAEFEWEKLLLHFVRLGNESVTGLLLEEGANVYARNDKGETPLHVAVLTGKESTVELLLNAGPDAIHEVDLNGNTPIHQAVLGGQEPHERVLASLLERFHQRTEAQALNRDRNTPLHLAILGKRFKMAKMLLAAQTIADAINNLCTINAESETIVSLIWPLVVQATDPDYQAWVELRQMITGLSHSGVIDF